MGSEGRGGPRGADVGRQGIHVQPQPRELQLQLCVLPPEVGAGARRKGPPGGGDGGVGASPNIPWFVTDIRPRVKKAANSIKGGVRAEPGERCVWGGGVLRPLEHAVGQGGGKYAAGEDGKNMRNSGGNCATIMRSFSQVTNTFDRLKRGGNL